MDKLSEKAILDALEKGEPFEAALDDNSIILKVREFVPYVCTAIHAGHNIRPSILKKCQLTDTERRYQEDAYAEQLIDAFPITIIVNTSRYEFDLNSPTEHCIHEVFKGAALWKKDLTKKEQTQSIESHERFYRILAVLLDTLEKRFGGALLIDLHSYNYKKLHDQNTPIFNIGTFQMDMSRWQKTLISFEKALNTLALPNLEVKAERNIVFEGKGYLATFILENHENTMVVPLEIKKVFMDEDTGELFPLVMDKLREGVYMAVLDAVTTFSKTLKRTKLHRRDLQISNLEPTVLLVDKALSKMTTNVEILLHISPNNIQQEKKRFLGQKGYQPNFLYRQLRIDPFEYREQLYQLPVSDIQDPQLRALYRHIIDTYAKKVDLLATVGSEQFLYNSLRFYGGPTDKDIANAKFLLHAAELPHPDNDDDNRFSAEQAKLIFEQAAEQYQLNCNVALSSRLISKAMVDNAKRTLLINKNARLTRLEINSLIHHELGVHMITTMNGRQQPLSIFSLGFPGNTHTQEGLAILAEYLSGNIDLARLKILSLRVLAVNMMVTGVSFSNVYRALHEQYKMSSDDAFNICVRVFRGGGFSKDFLYLSGFRDVLALYKSRNGNIQSLLTGKTSVEYIDVITSLIDRKIILPPKYLTPAFALDNQQSDPVIDYLIASIN